MATVVKQREQRVVLHDVSWATYEHLLADCLDSSSPHFTYDEGTLEIMSPSNKHERINRALASMVEIIAEEYGMEWDNHGSTTFKRKDLKRGFEPDSCFYFQNAERVRDREEVDLNIDPPPDLVIEIDITSGSIHKLAIYAALGIPEVWRYVGKRVIILTLVGTDYIEVGESHDLPKLTGTIIAGFIDDYLKLKRLTWVQNIREWARSHRSA